MSELLQKTTVLQCKLLRNIKVLGKLLVNDKVQKANNGTITVRISVTALLVSLLATCQPSYAIATHYQSLNSHSFNYVDVVAVNGNNARQELRKLLTTVLQHHTLVDVFLCLSFANCLFAGELRLALAVVRLWWGGHGNKPFIGRIPCAVLLRFSNLPTALTLGQSSKNLPFEKV